MTARFRALEAENRRLRQAARQSVDKHVDHHKRPYTVSERAAIFRDWSTVPAIGTLKPSTADASSGSRKMEDSSISDKEKGSESHSGVADIPVDSSADVGSLKSHSRTVPRLSLPAPRSATDVDEVVETVEAVGLPAVAQLCALLDAFEANGLRHEASLEDKADLFIDLAEEVRSLVAMESKLLEIRSPVYVFGDIHGNYSDLRFYMTRFNPTGRLGWLPHKLLFLGDYVDRGDHSIEVVTRLFIDKICTRV